ncbi:MAG: tRNA (adenosine(37)-N6)-threonylcarbamoyltransferase complex ATPase subunit type 1 TsaE [Gammaproteobacteria bacterium]|nr:tRNA (adenosine(37)-N6)-threonylcarbamoyltransferase complex ATPase subunit type 1 TsaE [Gammaproteobacteria bacterium]
MKQTVTIPDETAMMAFGRLLASHLPAASVVTLQGELGAGKTTLVRGILRALGWQGIVRSPTYVLIELYDLAENPSPLTPLPLAGEGNRVVTVCHIDLYRLTSVDEVEMLGLRDYLDGRTLLLIEWPERAQDALPAADLHCMIDVVGEQARQLTLQSEWIPLMTAVTAFEHSA